LFGKETTGLGPDVLASLGDDVFTIPMTCPNVRSLNISNAVSIVVYEARRQLGLA
jgi:tRNA (cytidine/uridine-2'-O-)-methyltransferase